MNFFFSYLKLLLVIFLLSTGYFAFKYWDKIYDRYNMQKVERSEFSAYFQEDTPLQPNKYVQALGYPSLKAKSEELRKLYNRREQAIKIIEERLRVMSSKNLISDEIVNSVNVNLTQARRINASIMPQIKNIIEFAEAQYASDMIRHDVAEDVELAERLAEENSRLMQSVEIPQTFR